MAKLLGCGKFVGAAIQNALLLMYLKAQIDDWPALLSSILSVFVDHSVTESSYLKITHFLVVPKPDMIRRIHEDQLGMNECTCLENFILAKH